MIALNVEQARFNMVEQQVRPWDVLDFRVLETLRTVPREHFVPQNLLEHAFSDLMLPIGHDQVMMPPVVEGRMLQALDIQPGEKVLEIGLGTGFTAACMAHLGGKVTSVDIFPEFVQAAGKHLDEQGFHGVEIAQGDASGGWDDGVMYDVIAITGAMPTVPDAYKAKLNQGGRLFVVVGEGPIMQALLITRESADGFVTTSLFETSVPYLVNAEPKPAFRF